MMLRAALGWLIAPAFVVACVGCSGASDDDGPDPDPETFLAFASDFSGYKSWEHFDITAAEGTPASTHLAGVRTIYINARPPAGATEFPVGTIIVKELSENPDAEKQIFCMVKRGGDYNANGATDWEWFELTGDDDSAMTILWRGVGPPAGEKYGGDPNGGCNGCHSGAKDNDFVQADGLALTP